MTVLDIWRQAAERYQPRPTDLPAAAVALCKQCPAPAVDGAHCDRHSLAGLLARVAS